MAETKIEKIRHSLSHLMAMAVLEKYPKAKLGVGPVIENGFYYDFDFDTNNISVNQRGNQRKSAIAEGDLMEIEKRMRGLIKKDLKFKKEIISFTEAKKIFKNQPYKLELIKEKSKVKSQKSKIQFKSQKLFIYKSGNFIDLCKGPHVKSTLRRDSGQADGINPDAFKLTRIAGAYWRGSEKNPMLTRIYGVAFLTKKDLVDYLQKQAEAEKRDHRILGQKLDLFSIDEEVGPGLVLWHPKGALLRQIIEDYWIKEHLKNGYEIIRSPHVGRIKLWQTSGHTDFYKENMFGPMEVEGDKYLIKPMNCPFHMKIYKTKSRSYRDLPLRWAELGTVYRYERSGVLHGLTRVRGFTQDDAHIICTPEQLADEIMIAVKFGIKFLKFFGFKDYNIYLATRPKKYVGTIKNWGKATNTLKFVLNKLKLKYQIDEGGGVFYGPKIDIKIKDSLGREWQCTTVQFDFNLPERFDLVYINNKGKKQRPYMIHRALLGSIERFVGVILEHFAGAFPLWLSPVQVKIINVGAGQKKYAKSVLDKFKEIDIRAELFEENLTVSKRIREAEIQKVPYIIVVGEKEEKNGTVNIRERGRKETKEMPLEDFIQKIIGEIKEKKLNIK